ncbi:multicopper oxidase family protein [Chiayiivirga flava]|uniref:FtsP/CotA-like multicopper oxidase with cupredoxin domain n=1 Tax=Chiayiivirga flava TaxID=659595 RepID=A0A7W8D890_9GAMM|nr:copper oxidase [Chiayiivirga flava]MBB5209771.1 FtsP/CotA-like multicopper oxidase with cupredoxin domain [Chiayiivirga flava]
MTLSRRNWFGWATAGALAPLGLLARRAFAQEAHPQPAQGAAPATEAATPAAQPTGAAARGDYTPVRTLNGWTLPPRMVDGVKEFHLVAEEIEHEFAPGCVAKCWGYNGTTPGPTIEAVEGDRVRLYVTNNLPEHTSMHWHGLLLPSGMDGVGGLSQPHIKPGETYVYEFTLRQHGTHMYHPHADEMTQMAVGMMGLFIIHPAAGEPERIDRDYAILLHNWALHPGTYRPDPSVMQDFDLWTFNSKVFPAIDAIVARSGERVRIRIGNLSMWNHPIHMHGPRFAVTGGDGGRWPRALWRNEVTEIVGVGQTRDLEFVAVPGDWAFHCHMAHHTMNAMGHEIPNTLGVDQSGVEAKIRAMLPGYMAMGETGMAEHQAHTESGHMPGPENTLPMMMGQGPFGPLEMGGMFTVIKVRDDLARGDYADPGWYAHPRGTVASRVDASTLGEPVRRVAPPRSPPTHEATPVDHSKMHHG